MRSTGRMAIVLAILAVLAAVSISLSVARTEYAPGQGPQPLHQPTPGPGDVPDLGGFI